MIQVPSSWFPFIDRNPQKFVPNIFEAGTRIFSPQFIRSCGVQAPRAWSSCQSCTKRSFLRIQGFLTSGVKNPRLLPLLDCGWRNRAVDFSSCFPTRFGVFSSLYRLFEANHDRHSHPSATSAFE
jgi:hypothetical protein